MSKANLDQIRLVVSTEIQALEKLKLRIDESYLKAIELILQCPGKVVLTGVGKSGLIAQKIASTLASTGTQAIFLHPAEAMHGDLGTVGAQDVVIAIGKSGGSTEVMTLIPSLKKIGVKLIAITGNLRSPLAKEADVVLDASVEKEACPHDLAPTSSTTVALVIGDALAMTLMKLKRFEPRDFALYHPGGKLGQRLSLRVSDLMIPLAECPIHHPEKAAIEDVLLNLSSFGIVLFSNTSPTLAGILTDGDIRRLLKTHKQNIFNLKVTDVMNRNPLTVKENDMAVDALEFMEKRPRPLNVAPVISSTASGKELVGLLRLHELLKLN